MMRLAEPIYNIEQTLDKCCEGITGNAELQRKVESNRSDLIARDADYLTEANAGALHTVAPINCARNDDPFVINDLKKSELIKIYDQYFVSEEKPARIIYDALLNAAKEKCPFCGGIGRPRNLDHYLPKAHFPQFSVIPRNMVPACRDCNMDGKAEDFATRPQDQVIQPYADNDRFFLEQWIFATYHATNNDEPGDFEFFVKPPDGWCEIDKQRVKKHFEAFDLGKRYAVKAAEPLGAVLEQIKRLMNAGLDKASISTDLLQPGVNKAPFVNHWQTGMYQALMQALP